jgi:hypothetical protein
MKMLSIGVRTLDTAYGLSNALESFGAELVKQAGGDFLVTVDLSGGRAEIVSVLNAISHYLTIREASPTPIDLDGRRYIMEPSPSEL